MWLLIAPFLNNNLNDLKMHPVATSSVERTKYCFFSLQLRNLPLEASDEYIVCLIRDIVPVIGFVRENKENQFS